MDREGDEDDVQIVDTDTGGHRRETLGSDIVERTGIVTSIVWNWFGYLREDSSQTKPVCKICRRTVSTKLGNTINLFNHLKSYHPVEYKKSPLKRSTSAAAHSDTCMSSGGSHASTSSGARVKQQSIASSFAAVTPYERNSRQAKTITNAVTYCLAKDMMPIYSVGKDGFRKLLNVLDSRYTLPSRHYFSRTALPQLYNSCRAEVENDLKKVTYYAATTDIWSSRTSQLYLSLTIHYIDDHWTLRNKCLQAMYFLEDHTGE